MKQVLAVILTTVCLTGQTFAQEATTGNFLTQIKNYDLSTILTADTIVVDAIEQGVILKEYEEKIGRPDILGFIGNTYQRLQIHFISIIQNPSNRYEYFAYGKTKVRETICLFQGTIKITNAQLYNNYTPTYRNGVVECEVNLYEDRKQHSTGFFTGKLSTNFLIDDKGVFRYDAVEWMMSDMYCNNQFVGTWTSYKTNTTKKCNWGEREIPDSDDFVNKDGAGFLIKDQFVKNGWENYMLYYKHYGEDTPEIKKAREKEEDWWK